MKRAALLEELAPLTRLIAQELLAQLKEDGLALAPQVVADDRRTADSEAEPGLLTLRAAASLLDHNYFWLSRNYKRLQLRPVRISGKLLFTRKELEEALERHKARFRGRPPRPSDQPPSLRLHSRFLNSSSAGP